MLDNTFINHERLGKESVMHKIMAGTFADPFKNIEDDYKDIKPHLMGDIESETDTGDNGDDTETTKVGKGNESKKAKKMKSYVPGIVKPIFKFPKMSKLNKEQQAMCLRVLLRFSESDKPKITQTEREELQNYMVNEIHILLLQKLLIIYSLYSILCVFQCLHLKMTLL